MSVLVVPPTCLNIPPPVPLHARGQHLHAPSPECPESRHCAGHTGFAETGFEHNAAVGKQTARGQHTPQPGRIRFARPGETHADIAQQSGADSANVVYDAAPTPEHHNLPPSALPQQGSIGGSGLGGGLEGMAAQPTAAGYGSAFNNTAAGAVGSVSAPAADRLVEYPPDVGLSGAAATQWAQSALAAGYMSGGGHGASALGGYGAAPLAGGSLHSGSSRLGSAAAPAGTVPSGVGSRAAAGNGFASGAIMNGLAGYPGSSSSAAASAGQGLVPQQLHQAAGGQQLQRQQPQADPAATLVAEHLEAAHRAYKAGRHLEALQLCNTVRHCLRAGSADLLSAYQCGMQATDLPALPPLDALQLSVLAVPLLQTYCSLFVPHVRGGIPTMVECERISSASQTWLEHSMHMKH